MQAFETFEQNLREMLNHLYDPAYRPPESLWKALGSSHEEGVQAIRDAVLAGIEDLKPPERVPLTALAWRIYGMLQYHFVENLPQELTAEKLGITARHLRRTSFKAIHALSLTLWEKTGGAVQESSGSQEGAKAGVALQNPDEALDLPQPASIAAEPEVSWREQLVFELEALEETAAGAVSNMAETIGSVMHLATHLTRQSGVSLLAEPVSPRLMAAIHPSVLRQVLISVIDQLAKQMGSGEIRISAAPINDEVHICLSGAPLSAALNNLEPISELLLSFNIAVQVQELENSFQITLALLLVDRCVLVVDDNLDMVHLYRRYLAGTRYYVQSVNLGKKSFEAIEQYHPDVMVLDVMLPDIDGWDLLTRLQENLVTRPLPVVICSVMHEKELALALGARYILAKPVHRKEFILALDAVLLPV